MEAGPIALRTRQSKRDSRVTLVTLADPSPELSSTALAPISSPWPPSSWKTRISFRENLHELDEEDSPVKAKRSRKSQLNEGGDKLFDSPTRTPSPAKSSPGKVTPRKSSPTKLRARLAEPHPEPHRWREVYEIVSRAFAFLLIRLICCTSRFENKGRAL